ncbi:hypothetical protein KAR91_02770 [Candidatus Pacearchaeota archaeon]|nr:hypothetical protein [Candidatus Pacearchaeota archaeon]
MRMERTFVFLTKIGSLRKDKKIRILHPVSWFFFIPYIFVIIIGFLAIVFWKALKEIWNTKDEFVWW